MCQSVSGFGRGVLVAERSSAPHSRNRYVWEQTMRQDWATEQCETVECQHASLGTWLLCEQLDMCERVRTFSRFRIAGTLLASEVRTCRERLCFVMPAIPTIPSLVKRFTEHMAVDRGGYRSRGEVDGGARRRATLVLIGRYFEEECRALLQENCDCYSTVSGGTCAMVVSSHRNPTPVSGTMSLAHAESRAALRRMRYHH